MGKLIGRGQRKDSSSQMSNLVNFLIMNYALAEEALGEHYRAEGESSYLREINDRWLCTRLMDKQFKLHKLYQ